MTDPGTVAAEQTWADEAALVDRLRSGDEAVFSELVRAQGPAMLRVATLFVRNRAVAEEIVQEAWLGVLTGIGRFEGRSSLRTWLFRILTNVAKTRAAREGRALPFSSLALAELEDGESSVDPDRFLPEGDRWANHWASSPRRFDQLPEGRLLAGETLDLVRDAIQGLPEAQRAVVTMRDLVGFGAEEVCEALGVSEINQRVLLHRGRTKVREALESYFEGDA
jgi:RNA polymerase sigma-70 factor (ECF subfamily)